MTMAVPRMSVAHPDKKLQPEQQRGGKKVGRLNKCGHAQMTKSRTGKH